MTASAPELRAVPFIADPGELEGIRLDPIAFARSLFARAGDVVRYEYGGWKTLVTRHPADLEHVARERKDNYVKLGTPDLLTLIPLLGNGLMTADRESWTQQRETLRSAFSRQTSADAVPVMRARLQSWIARIAALAADRQPFDLAEELRRLSLEIVADALLGAEMSDLVDRFAAEFAAMSGALSGYRPGDHAALQRYSRARAMIDGLTWQLLQRRRPGGLLSALVAERDAGRMSMRDVRDQILTMLFGGGETTSQAIGWTLHLLDRHPEVLASVQAEAAALPDVVAAAELDALDVTRRAVEESMRLFPPVWMMSRIALGDDELRGVPVAAGDLVVISLMDMHRHPAFWPDAERFDPDRFLPEAVAARAAIVYRPFSAGPRTCIGMGFARLEILLVISEICRRFRVRGVPGHPVEPEGTVVTLRPRYGLQVTAEPLS
jgi:cytochrome P450